SLIVFSLIRLLYDVVFGQFQQWSYLLYIPMFLVEAFYLLSFVVLGFCYVLGVFYFLQDPLVFHGNVYLYSGVHFHLFWVFLLFSVYSFVDYIVLFCCY